MKSNFFIRKIIFISLIFLFTIVSSTNAKELKLKASEILTYEEGNIIIGKNKAEAIIKDELEIFADKFKYNKKKEILIEEGNVVAFDLLNKIKINSNKIEYNEKNREIISYNETFFEIKDEYKINSSDVYYSIENSIIH